MKKKILMVGPFLSQSGYGHQARFAFDAVRSRPDLFDVFLINTGWGKTSWINADDEQRKLIDRLIQKTIAFKQAGGKFDINLQITIPNEVQKLAPVNILYTAGIETTNVSMQWLDKIRALDSMIVCSEHSKMAFESTSYDVQDNAGNKFKLTCNTPIEVVNYPVKSTKSKKIQLDLDYDFNFLSVAQWSPRKDLGTMIKAFYDQFNDKEVGLIMKTSSAGQTVRDRMLISNVLSTAVSRMKNEYPEAKCKLYLLHGDMTDEEMSGLYKHPKVKAVLSTTHGEGYGLPLFEAAYSGIPVVTHGWSGQADFLYVDKKPMFAECDYNLGPIGKDAVWQGVLEPHTQWAYIDSESFKAKMQEVYDSYEDHKKVAKKLKKHLEVELEQEKVYNKFIDSIMSNFEVNEELNQIVL